MKEFDSSLATSKATEPKQFVPAELTRILGEHVVGFAASDLPGHTVGVTRAAIMDQVGVMLAASSLAPNSLPFIEIARCAGEGQSAVIGHGFRSSALMAAFANGAMAHALDFEDTHDPTLVHPHAPVVAAALAVAEEQCASGEDLLAAVAIGADLSCRLALGFRGDPQSKGFLLQPTIGVFGATAAAARLLRLSVDQTIQAFALAFGQATQSTAVMTYDASDIRAVRDGFNAKAGVLSALLARAGLKAFDHPLEGPAGYYSLFTKDGYEEETVLADLGLRFHGAEVSFKPWPCCRGAHAFVEAALSLGGSFPTSAIERIDVEVSPFFSVLCEPPAQRQRPSSPIAAKFSIPYSVAVALTNGDVTIDDFEPDRLSCSALLSLAALVHHRVDQGRGTGGATSGSLTITLKSGQTFSKDIAHPLGHPNNPISHADLERKFLACARYAAVPLQGRQLLEDLAARLSTVDQLASIRDLF